MNKEISYTIKLKKEERGVWRVDLEDRYGNTTTVYEQNVDEAMKFARFWCNETEERKLAKDSMNNAIADMIVMDRIAGITTSTSDSLD